MGKYVSTPSPTTMVSAGAVCVVGPCALSGSSQ